MKASNSCCTAVGACPSLAARSARNCAAVFVGNIGERCEVPCEVLDGDNLARLGADPENDVVVVIIAGIRSTGDLG